MENFYVTNLVTKLGYYVIGIGTIALTAIVGAVAAGVTGFFLGALVGVAFAVPLLLACEFSYAIVTIAKNTTPPHRMANPTQNNNAA